MVNHNLVKHKVSQRESVSNTKEKGTNYLASVYAKSKIGGVKIMKHILILIILLILVLKKNLYDRTD